MRAKKVKSTILLFFTAIIWGFAFVAQRVGAEYLGVFTFNGIRFLLGAVSLIPVVLLFEREKFNKAKLKKTLLTGFLTGVILFAVATFQQLGVALTESSGKAGFLTGLYIIIVPVFRFFMGKKTSVVTFFSAGLAVIGLFLLCMNGDKIYFGTGDIILILGAVVCAVHILIVDKFVNGVCPLKYSMIQFFVCGFLSILIAFFTEPFNFPAIKNAGIPILYGGIMSVGVAYTCQILGQKNSDPAFASIVFSTESVFSAIGGAIILHEIMSGRGYLGCALIFIGIVLSQLDISAIKQKIHK